MGEVKLASVGMGNVLSQEKREQVIRLHEQPLRILATLVERPGAIATREELQKRFWGKDTFVDFEHSLSKAVNRLREALNDEPSRPIKQSSAARDPRLPAPGRLSTVSVTFPPSSWRRSPNRFARADTDSAFWPCSASRTLPPRLTDEG
jgi:hypothetical protein